MSTSYSLAIAANNTTEGDALSRSWTYTSAGSHEQSGVVTVASASEGSIAIGADITGGNDPGLVIVENLDGTNYLTLGIATGVRPIRVDAGQTFVLGVVNTATAIFHQADTADVQMRYKIVER